MVSSLDDLDKECWSVLKWLGEDLEKVSLVIVVNKDIQLLDGIKILCNLSLAVGKVSSEVVIVSLWDGQENTTSLLHVGDGVDDVLGSEGDMLDTWSSVKVDVLLNLGLSLTWSWLIDWHLDVLVKVSDDD